jgi:cation diffusion facilitator family transporter
MSTINQINTIPTNNTLVHVGWISVGINIFLTVLNAVLGVLSGSIAVTAEAVHNLVDLIGSVGVVAGLKLSQRKSTEFPYGLYKVENFVALIIALLIFLAGYEIAEEALFSESTSVVITGYLVVGVILSLVVPVLFGVYEVRIGRQGNSPSLIAAGQEFKMHAFSSGAVLLGLAGQAIIGWELDRWAGLIVVIFILQTGWELSKDAVRALLDASLGAETLNTVREILDADPLTVQVLSVIGRNSGRYRFIEANVTLRTHDLNRAEIASHRMEQAVQSAVPHVERILIHSSPTRVEKRVCAVPVVEDSQLLTDCFCHADSFHLAVINGPDGQIEKNSVYRNPFLELEHGKGIQLGKWLVKHKVDLVVTPKDLDGKGLAYVLSDAGVEIRQTSQKRLKEVLLDVCNAPFDLSSHTR